MASELFAIVPDDWESVTLADVLSRGGGFVQTGPFGSQLHASDYVVDGEVPSIMPVNIGDNRIVAEGIARIARKDADRLARHLVRPGDVIYSRRGDVERRALIRAGEDGWLCGTGCLLLRFGSAIDPRFASYYLGHPAVRAWISRHAVGITMPNLNAGIMAKVPFLLPPRSDQVAIADCLDLLDSKANLNRRTGQSLELLARAVFRAWFVDFAPVRAKAAGAGAFPGMPADVFAALPDRLVDSELGPLPVEWQLETFGNLLELSYGRALKAETREPGTIPVFGSNGQVGWHDTPLVRGEGIVVGRKGNPGTVKWVGTSFFPIDTTFYVKPKDGIGLPYLFHALREADLPSMSVDSAALLRSHSLA